MTNPIYNVDIAGTLRAENQNLDVSSTFNGIRSFFTKTSGTSTNASMSSGNFRANMDQSGGQLGTMSAVAANARIYTGTANAVAGLTASGIVDTDGTATTVSGIRASVDTYTSNITDVFGIHVTADVNEPISGTSYLLYLADQSNIDYGLYHNGAAPSYLGGNLGIGNTAPTEKLDVTENGKVSGTFAATSITATSINASQVVKLTPLSSAPSSPDKGDMYFDDTTNKLRVYDGTTWQDCW